MKLFGCEMRDVFYFGKFKLFIGEFLKNFEKFDLFIGCVVVIFVMFM